MVKHLINLFLSVFRRHIRRKWRLYTFQSREILDPYLQIPLPPGRYRIKTEWWEVRGPPRIGETATAYWAYVQANGHKVRERESVLEIEL